MNRLTTESPKGGLAFTFDLDVTCKTSEMEKIKRLGEKLKKYEDTGLTPEQLAEVDKMYSEKCKALAAYENTGLQPDEVERMKDNAVDVIITKLKEQREQISLSINAKDTDQFNKLNLMRAENDVTTAIRILEKWSTKGKIT